MKKGRLRKIAGNRKLRKTLRYSIDTAILTGLIQVLAAPYNGKELANRWIHEWDTRYKGLTHRVYDGICMHASSDAKLNAFELKLKGLERYGESYNITKKNLGTIRILDGYNPNFAAVASPLGIMNTAGNVGDEHIVHEAEHCGLFEKGWDKVRGGKFNILYFWSGVLPYLDKGTKGILETRIEGMDGFKKKAWNNFLKGYSWYSDNLWDISNRELYTGKNGEILCYNKQNEFRVKKGWRKRDFSKLVESGYWQNNNFNLVKGYNNLLLKLAK